MSGGGGMSGEVIFPEYISNFHNRILTGTGGNFGYHVYSELARFSLAANNPYYDPDEDSFTDPTAWWTAVHDNWASHRTLLANISPHAEVVAQLDDAVTAFVTSSTNVDTLADTAHANAMADVVAAYESYADTIDRPVRSAELGAVLSQVFGIALPTVDIQGASDAGEETALSLVQSARVIVTDSSPIAGEWNPIIDNALAQLGTLLALRPDVDVDLVIQQAHVESLSEVGAVSAAIMDAIDPTVIAGMLEAYEQRQEYRLADRLRAYNSGMASANAVHGSAFVIGRALIEAQQESSISEQGAAIITEMYRGGLATYTQMVQAKIAGRMQGHAGNSQERLALIQTATQGAIQLSAARDNFSNALLGVFDSAYRTRATLGAQEDMQGRAEHVQLAQAAIQHAQAFLDSERRHLTELVQLYVDSFKTNLAVQFQTSEGQVAREYALAQQAGQAYLELYNSQLSQGTQMAGLMAELTRMRTVAQSEYEGSVIDLNAKYFTWKLDMLEKGSNILAGPAGMTAFAPKGPSTGRSVLGGALGGASLGGTLGSAIPGVGTAIGAGVGAIFGGLAGLL